MRVLLIEAALLPRRERPESEVISMGPGSKKSDLDIEQVYAEYYHTVYGFALRLCRSPETAEEITQETFFKALKSIGKFKGESKLSVWLCQIAKNTYATMLRRQKHRAPPPEEDLPDPGDLAESFSDRETALAIHRALHALPEPYREVFWLRTFGELNYTDIAALFQKTESWARVTYHRARQRIKEGLS